MGARARAWVILSGLLSVVAGWSAWAEQAPGSDAEGGSLLARSDVRAFIDSMVTKHGLAAGDLRRLFSQTQVRPEILDLMRRPAEAKPWYAYRPIFLDPERVEGGVAFWDRHAPVLARAEAGYGVPAEVIVAIIGVETRYGQVTGNHRVADALATLAFDYPKRSSFFRRELEEYLLMVADEGMEPLAIKGSYAGAMGLAQFMPSSFRAYAVDFDHDGKRDLINDPADAIGSVANYLARHKWQPGGPVAVPVQVRDRTIATRATGDLKPNASVGAFLAKGVAAPKDVPPGLPAALLSLEGRDGPEYWLGFNNFYVITRYNRSPLYAMAVHQLAQAITAQRSRAGRG